MAQNMSLSILVYEVTTQPILVKTAIRGEKGKILGKLLYVLAAPMANTCGFLLILPYLVIIEPCLSSYFMRFNSKGYLMRFSILLKTQTYFLVWQKEDLDPSCDTVTYSNWFE